MEQDQIGQLRDLFNAINAINEERLLRPQLEDGSLEEFATSLAYIRRFATLAADHGTEIPQGDVQQLMNSLGSIKEQLETQASRPTDQYVASRHDFLSAARTAIDELKRKFWPSLVAEAVIARGLLDDGGIQRELERTIESIREESNNTIQQVKEEAKKATEEAKSLADEIESRARPDSFWDFRRRSAEAVW